VLSIMLFCEYGVGEGVSSEEIFVGYEKGGLLLEGIFF
jgi:hypothetical protein